MQLTVHTLGIDEEPCSDSYNIGTDSSWCSQRACANALTTPSNDVFVIPADHMVRESDLGTHSPSASMRAL